MASETFYSPKAPVRYAHLITANLYKDKWSYSVELMLNEINPAHKVFLEKLESEFVALHGTKRERNRHGEPWANLGEGNWRVKFKTRRFDNPDGTFSKGPLLVDAKKAPWNGQEIGNGSEMIISFTIRDWMDDGAGVSLHLKACQVVSFVPREDGSEKAVDGFEERDGYSVASATPATDEFDEFSEAPF
jgi:hypothetical protein